MENQKDMQAKPCEKEQYTTRELAIAAIKQISERNGHSMRAYNCGECGLWHIASNGKRKYIKRKKQSVTITNFETNKNAKKHVPAQQSRALASEKLITREMAAALKRLIEGRNQLEKQKNTTSNETTFNGQRPNT